jgi:hypothetical protein
MKIKTYPTMLALLVVLSSSAHAATIIQPDANTVLLWRLDETSGNTYADASANGRNGTGFDVAPGQITDGLSGVLGNAVGMGGTTGRNFIRNSTMTTSTFAAQDFTLQIWVENPLLTSADATLGRVIAQQRAVVGSSSFVDWSLGVTSTGALTVFGNNGGSISYTSNSLIWDANTWYNLSLVADTTGGITTYTLYRAANGDSALTLIGSFEGYAPGALGASPGIFSIGGDSSTTAAGRRYGGLLDEVQYSNVARSEAYLLAAVIPEPSAACLLSLAAVFTVCSRRKQPHRR